MSSLYPAVAEDIAELEAIRTKLTQARRVAGIGAGALSHKIGRATDFISRMERGVRDSPHMSSLQQWAGGLDMRVEFGVENFWLHAHGDQEMLALWAMSRQWGSHGDAMLRLWLPAALRMLRIRKGISSDNVAMLLGLTPGAITDWEAMSGDPVVKRAMMQARALGTRVTMTVWHREDWVFS